LQFFGRWGLLSAASGGLAALFLIFRKFVVGVEIMKEHGPLALAAIFLIICGIQLISLGLVGEMLSRTYYETQNKRIYSVAETKRFTGAASRFRA
jgi:hypothetical protein